MAEAPREGGDLGEAPGVFGLSLEKNLFLLVYLGFCLVFFVVFNSFCGFICGFIYIGRCFLMFFGVWVFLGGSGWISSWKKMFHIFGGMGFFLDFEFFFGRWIFFGCRGWFEVCLFVF